MAATQAKRNRFCISKTVSNGNTPNIFLVPLLTLAILAFQPATGFAVVKFFDGFGDADRNNDGTALDPLDVDTTTNGVGTWTPARASNTAGATNTEVMSVLDASDVGLRWLSNSGFTNNNTGDRRAFIAIVDDTQGAMLETQPTGTPGGLGKTAINSGYALSYNAKGRGNSAAAFFDETIALGPEVGDSVKVTFDFRVWRDAPNANSFEEPLDAELRFGLFQDTDDQLGQTNPVAGPDVDLDMNGSFETRTAAVWGQEDGYFEGTRASILEPGSDIGAPGDAGWLGAVIIEDPNGAFPHIVPNGGDWRIREETNLGSGNDVRILQGTTPETDTVAVPQEMNPGTGDYGLTNLDINKVWRLSLELIRATDQNPGDTITAVLTATDITTGTPGASYSLMDTEPAMQDDGNGNMIPGIFSDSWDYFAIRNTGIDDFDMLLDNFMLEIFGSNAVSEDADFNADGKVDGRDFLIWQRGYGMAGGLGQGDANGDGMINDSDLSIWQSQYSANGGLSNIGAVPEPSTSVLLACALTFSTLGRRRAFLK